MEKETINSPRISTQTQIIHSMKTKHSLQIHKVNFKQDFYPTLDVNDPSCSPKTPNNTQ